MNRQRWRSSVIAGLCGALFTAFGLTPTAWGFYQLSHALNAPSLYPLYSFFRGADYLISLQSMPFLYYLISGLLIGSFTYLTSMALQRGKGAP